MPMVEYSAVFDGDAERVWSVLKQFGEIHQWHPEIRNSVIEAGLTDGLVGGVRRLELNDGAILRERLLSVDDSLRRLSYCFEESPLPLDNYVASIHVISLTGTKQSVIHWSASFELAEPDPAQLNAKAIQALIIAGHDNLQRFLR
ncbi:SRPBCC family protein [Shewanella baltica]|uniref:Polyketide cyclase n=1 Tax=Shewanella baltica (strain OS155 / ATCC BAA-1091) TaxID=325240 RepID=A3D091_SHEB5|nr:SRPBCC family protein [Shewanella baltica]ABN60154.1 conserved hypothetical protein [Shewanella baltica OS155]AEH12550.1 Polyketide cyclase/dehydrase [Shewanella baltica OS117]